MEENVKVRWLIDKEQNKIAPKTLSTQILNEDGTHFKDTVETAIADVETEVAAHVTNGDIHVTAAEKEAWNNIEVPSLEGYATEAYVENLYTKLNSNTVLGFYCIEDVTIVTNGISKVYPANSNVEVSFIEGDTFEIIPTSDNSILALTAFPGALGTYYSWLEGVAQFSNILFDMNDEAMYSKWSQGNQGAYHVQKAQYVNCIFWSDNPYISDVTKRTNYTLTHTSQLPLCYSTIPDNTFKSFYLAFGVNSDPNWGNQAYKDSFAKATWATQVFSYYGATTIGIVGHDDPDFNIVLPKDCRGLMFDARHIQNAGTFDAVNVTNFGAKSGSWREAFGFSISLKRLFIKNLKVSLNISWSPVDYESISYIISAAANTNAITISVSPYTYNLLSQADFDLAASKNITIALITTNYVEDRRLEEITNKADKSYVDEKIADLVNSAPETLDTLGELAAAFNENEEVINTLNEAVVAKADKTYVDELVANIPIESDVVIVDCPDGTILSHTFEQIIAAINEGKAVYASIYGTVFMPLTYVADDNSYAEFHIINAEVTEDQYSLAWVEGLRINSDNTFTIKFMDLLTRRIEEIQSSDGEKDIVTVVNRLIEKTADIDNKQNKNVIVYRDSTTGKASMTAAEIMAKVREGVNVYFTPSLQGGTLHPYLEGSDNSVFFYSNYIDNSRVIGTGILIDAEGNITNESYQLGHLSDTTIHITADEREKWNGVNLDNYYTKTETDELLDTKANTENPVFSGSLSMNAATEPGFAAVALGFVNKATGMYSLAEGMGTQATGDASHAEGTGTKAPGYAAHAEGSGTEASNVGSHAEGANTIASGYGSHAEGKGTIASGQGQHVEGTFNLEDSTAMHIVGNGTSETKRSNAHTLSSTGEAWFAGDIYVGSTSGTNRDEGSKKLATEEYVDNKEYEFFILKSSTPGSNKKFKITITDDGILSSEEVVE